MQMTIFTTEFSAPLCDLCELKPRLMFPHALQEHSHFFPVGGEHDVDCPAGEEPPGIGCLIPDLVLRVTGPCDHLDDQVFPLMLQRPWTAVDETTGFDSRIS
jgi:hypothetical protein